MLYVSDLFGCCCFTGRDRPFSERRETQTLSLLLQLGQLYLIKLPANGDLQLSHGPM